MAATISSIANSVKADLDTAYGEDSQQDFEALKASLIAQYLPAIEDQTGVLSLAGLEPENSFSDPSSSASDAHSKMESVLADAFDSELSILQNP